MGGCSKRQSDCQSGQFARQYGQSPKVGSPTKGRGSPTKAENQSVEDLIAGIPAVVSLALCKSMVDGVVKSADEVVKIGQEACPMKFLMSIAIVTGLMCGMVSMAEAHPPHYRNGFGYGYSGWVGYGASPYYNYPGFYPSYGFYSAPYFPPTYYQASPFGVMAPTAGYIQQRAYRPYGGYPNYRRYPAYYPSYTFQSVYRGYGGYSPRWYGVPVNTMYRGQPCRGVRF